MAYQLCRVIVDCANCKIYIYIYIGLSPLPVRVTTRIITFLVGNPYKPSFPLLLGGGTTQYIDKRSSLTKQINIIEDDDISGF